MSQSNAHPQAARVKMSAWVEDKAGLLLVLLAGATLAAHLGRYQYFFELASHFRAFYLAGALGLAILLLALKSWRWVALGVMVMTLNLGTVLPYYLPRETANTAPNLRVLAANVQTSNPDHTRLVSRVLEQQPDVLVLLEVDARWLTALEAIREHYPYAVSQPQNDNFGIALLSRFPFTNERIFELRHGEAPAISVHLTVSGRPVTLFAVHTLPPGSRQMAQVRDAQLTALADLARNSADPVVVCGDFNATPWSPIFKDVIARSKLTEARRGFGYQGTWPANRWPCTIPLDHCLVSKDIRVRSFTTLSSIGSDHLPLFIELVIPPSREQNTAPPLSPRSATLPPA